MYVRKYRFMLISLFIAIDNIVSALISPNEDFSVSSCCHNGNEYIWGVIQ